MILLFWRWIRSAMFRKKSFWEKLGQENDKFLWTFPRKIVLMKYTQKNVKWVRTINHQCIIFFVSCSSELWVRLTICMTKHTKKKEMYGNESQWKTEIHTNVWDIKEVLVRNSDFFVWNLFTVFRKKFALIIERHVFIFLQSVK